MRKRGKSKSNLENSMTKRISKTPTSIENKKEYEGNDDLMVNTGSTLLNLAISGGRKRGGGLPIGIMVVAYGPSGTGKTVLACELAGELRRMGWNVNYKDAEGRLNKTFAKIFSLNLDEITYSKPDIIPEVFKELCNPKTKHDTPTGYIVDSLAALSTSLEMDNEDGDKMGGRRAKEFGMYLRKSKQIISKNNMLLFCTNQIRENMDSGTWGKKDVNPGGKAIEFYPSLILKFTSFKNITNEITFKGKTIKRVVGIEGEIEVSKSSVWKPYRKAPISIYFDYGIDDIRENLKFVKKYTGNTMYQVNDLKLHSSIEKSIQMVENNDLEDDLKNQVIDLWMDIENKFEVERKPKKR